VSAVQTPKITFFDFTKKSTYIIDFRKVWQRLYLHRTALFRASQYRLILSMGNGSNHTAGNNPIKPIVHTTVRKSHIYSIERASPYCSWSLERCLNDSGLQKQNYLYILWLEHVLSSRSKSYVAGENLNKRVQVLDNRQKRVRNYCNCNCSIM